MTKFNYCDHCKRYFLSAGSLNRHLRVYNAKQFFYPCCKEAFTWANCLEDHQCFLKYDENPVSEDLPIVNDSDTSASDHSEKEGLYRCNNCPSTFNRYRTLKCHIIKYKDPHNFPCKVCKKHFFTPEALKKHLCFLIAGQFQCSCMEYFRNLRKFKEHVGKHRPYYCCLCKHKNMSFNNLINHIRTHTKEKPFKCDVCNLSFRVRESLSAHMKLHNNDRSHRCSKCDYSATSKWNLQLHEKRHAPTEERKKEFLCATCGSCFYLKHHLRRHIETHSEQRLHLCRFCGKLFSQGAYLEKHLEKHSRDSEMGQKCTVCWKELLKNEVYQHHVDTGHFQFVCDPCCKVFLTKFNLQRHQRTHGKLNKHCSIIS